MGNDSQGAVLPGEVQGVKQGAGILIATDGTISVDATSVVGLVKLNNASAFNGYVWPNTKGAQGQFLTMGTGNTLTWTNGGVFVSATAPVNPEIGDLWFDCTVGQLLVYEACTSGAPKWTSGSEGFPVIPGNSSASPAFVSGSGTLLSPYVCSATTVSSGSAVTVLNVVTITGLAPFQFVNIVDLNAYVNGGRFSFTNNVANASGILTFEIVFTDSPLSPNATTYTANIKVGNNSIYIRSTINIVDAFFIVSPGTITGSPLVGQTLTYTPGTYNGGAPPVTTSWKWYENTTGTVLQTGGTTYVTTASEFGDTIFVIFTATDTNGVTSSAPTPQFGPIDRPPFPNPTPPSIPTNSTGISTFIWDGPSTTLSSSNCLQFNVNGGTFGQGPTPVVGGNTVSTRWNPSISCANASNGTFIDGCLFDASFSTCSSLTIDRIPTAPVFTPVTNIVPGQVATSNTVTPTGYNSTCYISYNPASEGSNWQASINGAPFVNLSLPGVDDVSMNPGDTLRVRFTTGSSATTNYDFVVDLGAASAGVSSTFTATTGTAGFPNLPASLVNGPLTIPGVVSGTWADGSVSLTSAGCLQISLDGSTFGTGPLSLSDGLTLYQRWEPTGGSCGGANTNTLISGSMGGGAYTNSYSLTLDRVPAAFTIGNLTGQATSSTITSSNVSITGINAPAFITLAAGATLSNVKASVGGGAYTLIPASGSGLSISPGQSLTIRGDTGSGTLTTYSATVSIGQNATVTSNTWNVETANVIPSISQPSITLPLNGSTNINAAQNIPAGISYVGNTYNPLNGAGAHTASDWQVFTNTGDVASGLFTSNVSAVATGSPFGSVQAAFKNISTSNVISVASPTELIFANSTNLTQFTPGSIIVQSGGSATVSSVDTTLNKITISGVTGSFTTGLPCTNTITMDQANSTQLVNNGAALLTISDATANSWGITSAAGQFTGNDTVQIPARSALGSLFTIDIFIKSTATALATSGGLIIPSSLTGDSYTYHVFTNPGTFTSNVTAVMDVMAVGGGSQGFPFSTGGGGGGVVVSTNLTVPSGSKSVTVGAGGGAGGGNSCFDTLVSAFGGGPGTPIGSPRGDRAGSGSATQLFGTNPTTPAALGGPYPAALTQGYNANAGGPYPNGEGFAFSAGGGGGAGADGNGPPGDRGGGPGGAGRTVPQFPGPAVAIALPGVPVGFGGTYGGGGAGGGGIPFCAAFCSSVGGAGGGGPAGPPSGVPGLAGLGGGGGSSNAPGTGSGSGGKGNVMVRYSTSSQAFWSWSGNAFEQINTSYAWGGQLIGEIDGNWHHIRVTNSTIYFDGLDLSIPTPAKPNLTSTSYLGNVSAGGRPINGQIGALRVLNGVNLGQPPVDTADIFNPAGSGTYGTVDTTTLTFVDSTNLSNIFIGDLVQQDNGVATGTIYDVQSGTNQITVNGSVGSWVTALPVEDLTRSVFTALPGLASTNTITGTSGGGANLTISGADVDGFVIGQTVSNGLIGGSLASGTLTAVGPSTVSVTPPNANWANGQILYRGTPLVNNQNDTVNLTTYLVPFSLLDAGQPYNTRVRYDSAIASSPYSNWNTITTSDPMVPTIGQSFGGGFFAGQFIVFEGSNPVTYNLIVGDTTNTALYDISGKQWKTANSSESSSNIFQNLINGKLITDFALSNGYNSSTYPIWQYVNAARLAAPGGYSDWYLPSAAELALIYQNLKPSTTANTTSARTSQTNTSILNGEGQWNGTMGNNQSSGTASPFTFPAFTGFTGGVPAQTASTAFRVSNVQAMDNGVTPFWSATEASSSTSSVWSQLFETGNQTVGGKNQLLYVRLVRRELA